VEPDVFGRYELFVAGGLLSAPGGATDVDSVGVLVTGAAVALELDEGFQQHGAKSVAYEPIFKQLACGL